MYLYLCALALVEEGLTEIFFLFIRKKNLIL